MTNIEKVHYELLKAKMEGLQLAREHAEDHYTAGHLFKSDLSDATDRLENFRFSMKKKYPKVML